MTKSLWSRDWCENNIKNHFQINSVARLTTPYIKLVYQDGIPTAGFKFIPCQKADKKFISFFLLPF